MKVKSIVNDLSMSYKIDIKGMNMNDVLIAPKKLVEL